MDEVTLTGEGVLLRAWRPEDASAVHAACQDPQIQRWTTVPSPYHPEDAAAFVASSPGRWAAGLASFGVFDAADGRLLGAHGFRGAPEPDVYEIGYWIAASARGRGVGTAATRLVCDWAFTALDAVRLEWQAEVGNHASRRLAEKVGFVVEGTLRRRLIHHGDRVDGWIAGMLPEDLRRAAAGTAPD
jgi:RimJ/RimL family protein N-acetyltransferase